MASAADGSNRRDAVPKFRSFQPEGDALGACSGLASEPDGSNAREDDRKRESGRDRSGKDARRHRHHRDASEKSRHSSRHRHRRHHGHEVVHHKRTEVDSGPKAEHVAADSTENVEDLWQIDRKGDRKNVTFGAIHRYDVPSYLRTGAGYVLGAPSSMRINTDSDSDEDGKSVQLVSREASGFGTGAKNVLDWKQAESGERELCLRPAGDNGGVFRKNDEFVSFATTSKQGDLSLPDHPGGASPEGEHARGYLSGDTDEGDTDKRKDSNPEYMAKKTLAFQRELLVQQRNAQLEKRTRAYPKDVKCWLELIALQDELLKIAGNAGKVTHSEGQNSSSYKISLYEKALRDVEEVTGRTQLLLGMMQEGSKYWGTARLMSKWKSVMQENKKIPELWPSYLDFRQSNFGTFSVDGCRTVFGECLEELSSSTGHNPLRIYTVLRYTLFLRESGFVELGISLWQALLELNFWRPQELDGLELSEVITHFEKFWNSEVPRIGEPGAEGWASLESVNIMDVDANKPLRGDSAPVQDEKNSNIFRDWCQQELQHMQSSRLPARVSGDVADPYRVVLFCDIRPFLMLLEDEASQLCLVNAFLAFCSLPPLPLELGDAPLADQFVYNTFLNRPDESLRREWFSKDLGGVGEGGKTQPQSLVRCFPSTSNSLFLKNPAFLSSFRPWLDLYPSDSGPVPLSFIRHALAALVTAVSLRLNEGFLEYCLAFVSHNSSLLETRKVAKKLLCVHPTSMRLYNAYALALWSHKEYAAANKVWVSALNVARSTNIDRILLLYSWSNCMLDIGDNEAALMILLCWGDQDFSPLMNLQFSTAHGFELTPSRISKAQWTLGDGTDTMILTHKYLLAVYYASCLSLLAYLSKTSIKSPNLEAALSCIDNVAKLLGPSSYALEVLYTFQVRLIYQHVTHTVSPPSTEIRTALETSVSRFPSNSAFISLYAWNESRFHFADRVRSIVNSTLHSTVPSALNSKQNSLEAPMLRTVIPQLISLVKSTSRPVGRGYSADSVRSAFRRLVSPANNLDIFTSILTPTMTASSPTIWKLYFLFEIEQHDYKRARDVWFQALRRCGWCKAMYLMGYEHLPIIDDEQKSKDKDKEEETTDEAMIEVYNAMQDKELRIYNDLCDYLKRNKKHVRQSI